MTTMSPTLRRNMMSPLTEGLNRTVQPVTATWRKSEAIHSIRIRRIGASHRGYLFDVGSFVEGAAQPRFPRWIIYGVDAFAIASRLLGPLLKQQMKFIQFIYHASPITESLVTVYVQNDLTWSSRGNAFTTGLKTNKER